MEAEDRKKNSKPLFSLSEQLHCNPHDQKGELERARNKKNEEGGSESPTLSRQQPQENEQVEEVEEVVEEPVTVIKEIKSEGVLDDLQNDLLSGNAFKKKKKKKKKKGVLDADVDVDALFSKMNKSTKKKKSRDDDDEL